MDPVVYETKLVYSVQVDLQLMYINHVHVHPWLLVFAQNNTLCSLFVAARSSVAQCTCTRTEACVHVTLLHIC